MRPALWFTLVASLIFTSPLAHAGKRDKLPGGSLSDRGDGLVGMEWSCADTLLDLRNRKGEGAALCLRGLLLHPWSGRSVVVAEVLWDVDDPLDAQAQQLKLRLDAGQTDRYLSEYDVVSLHVGEGQVRPLELQAAAPLVADAQLGAVLGDFESRLRVHATVAWQFQTWDPSIGLRYLKVKVGGDVSGGERWVFDTPLTWREPWPALPEVVWDEAYAASQPECQLWDVRKKDADDASDAVGRGAAQLPLQLRFDALSSSEKTSWEIYFKDHGFVLRFDEGKLVVKGAEKFLRPLPTYDTDGQPNRVELAYDGTFATVRVGDLVFGPMQVRAKGSADKSRLFLKLNDAKTRFEDLRVSNCSLEDPERWAPPVAEVAAAPAPRAVDQVAAPTARVARAGQAPAETAQRGHAVLALRVRAGEKVTDKQAEAKQVRSALEVMQAAATAVQGGVAVGQAMGEFAGDVKHNKEAMDRGDYGSMRSSSTRVNIGADGSVETSRAEASLGADGRSIEMKGRTTRIAAPRKGLADAIAGAVEAGEDTDPRQNTVVSLTNASDGPVSVRIEGVEIGPLEQRGEYWEVLVAPGSWTLEVVADGRLVAGGVLRAAIGGHDLIDVGADGTLRAEPEGAVERK